LQFIAHVLINIELSVFNGGELSKLRGRIIQGANKPGGERAKGQTSQNQPGGEKKPEGEKARGRISQEVKQPRGEKASHYTED